MAGDWIKMRIDLQSHPKIVRILSATDSDKFRAIGGLHAVWSIFDTHSEDGVLLGYSAKTLDHVIGWDGFTDAMISVGWVEEVAGGLVMPGFDEHNGKSGKRRAEDQKRKRDGRKDPQPVRKLSAGNEDKKGTREEKRREDQKPLSPEVDECPAVKLTYSMIQQAYNEICPPTFPACAVMNDKRKKQIKAMGGIDFMGSKPFTQGLEVWRQYFADCLTNPHWCGRNDSSWTADFDFVTNPKNAIKLMERMN